MSPTALQFHNRLWLVLATALIAACTDAAGPTRSVPTTASLTTVQLGACGDLAAAGELTFHAYATGVQIYRWNGTSWVFVAPRATLYADAQYNAVVGSHYAGPTWESVSGSTVVGTMVKRCTPNANAIPWLLLDAVANAGPGVLRGITEIQRVNTVGGVSPATPGSVLGEIAEAPYTAEYLFYRGQ